METTKIGETEIISWDVGGGNRILALWDDDDDGVNDPHETAVIATASGINHGIQIHDQYLYASNPTTLFRWRYQAGQRTNLGDPQIVISNVPCCHHTTRTPIFDTETGLLYLQVGSNSNVDPDSTHARIHRFNISSGSFPIDWNQGFLFADGLRNEVGLAFDQAGRLWGVEMDVINWFGTISEAICTTTILPKKSTCLPKKGSSTDILTAGRSISYLKE